MVRVPRTIMGRGTRTMASDLSPTLTIVLKFWKNPPIFATPIPIAIGKGLKNIPGRYIKFMLIIDSKDCENIDKALKKYKKKFEKSKVLLQLRERQSFTKPSVKRRGQVLKAIYKQKIASGKIEE
jgi:small subunit ribosomal protein S21